MCIRDSYWSMWNSTEPQAIAIQEAIDAYTAETGIQVTVQWNGRDTQQQTIQAALDSKTSIDLFDEDFQRVSTQYNKSCLSLEDMAAAVGLSLIHISKSRYIMLGWIPVLFCHLPERGNLPDLLP